jgi:hypothetical protein
MLSTKRGADVTLRLVVPGSENMIPFDWSIVGRLPFTIFPLRGWKLGFAAVIGCRLGLSRRLYHSYYYR